MVSLESLETHLREIEEDIQETTEEIARQQNVVRQMDDPFQRRYAEHVLASYKEQVRTALAEHLQISKMLVETKDR